VLIENGLLIDGSGSQPLPGVSVLVSGDEIVDVGPVAQVAASAPHDVERIDATGATIMPGLIDSHCHITFDDVQSNDELFFHRPAVLSALVTGFNLRKLLQAGVTGFMDPDTVHGIGPQVRDAIEAGVLEGPRMATGVQALLTAVGGTAGRLIPDEGAVGYAKVVNTTDDMVTVVRQQIKHGADWIKIHATGSIPRHAGELQVWSLDELRAVCDTSHALGVPVTAHCRNASSTEALEAVIEQQQRRRPHVAQPRAQRRLRGDDLRVGPFVGLVGESAQQRGCDRRVVRGDDEARPVLHDILRTEHGTRASQGARS